MNDDRAESDGRLNRGTLWTHNPEVNTFYRIDSWTRSGTGEVVPKDYEEVPKERVPPEHRRNTVGLKAILRQKERESDRAEVSIDGN